MFYNLKKNFMDTTLDMADMDIATHAPSAESPAEWSTSKCTALHPIHHYAPSGWVNGIEISLSLPSHSHYGTSVPTLWASRPTTFLHDPLEQLVPWRSSLSISMCTPYAPLLVGVATKFCATSMSHCDPLFRGTPQPWFMLGNTPSYQKLQFS